MSRIKIWATFYNYIHFLEEAKLIQLLYPSGISMTKLQKPEKIYLENTNLAYALTGLSQPDMGNLRETFVFNQLKAKYEVSMPKEGDFSVNKQWILEVGGKNKTRKQIANIPNSYRVLDNFEFKSIKDIIPLWMVGFLY
jgi:predicted AAA+ superfamily ATPase